MRSHEYRGEAKPRQRRSTFSQASRRRPAVCYDQHGREWTFPADLKTGMPAGPLVPSFSAPWLPDQTALKVNPDNITELFIDYRAMLLPRKARRDEYHRHAVKVALDHKMPEPALGEYSDELISFAGYPPRPVEPIIAALQGNTYILGPEYAEDNGRPYRVDKRLERFVERPAEDLMLGSYDFRDVETRDFAAAKADAEEHRDEFGDAEQPVAPTAEAEPTLDEDAEEFGDFDAATDDVGDEDVASIVDGLDLEELEEEYDEAASGGRTVKPQQTERAARQAPRRPASNPVRAKHGAKRSANARPTAEQRAAQRGGRRTLADGAVPVIGGGGV